MVQSAKPVHMIAWKAATDTNWPLVVSWRFSTPPEGEDIVLLE